MSKRYTMHAESNDTKNATACGVKVGPKRRTSIKSKIECKRCRSIMGIAHTWAQQHARKPPKQATRPKKHSDLVALDAEALAQGGSGGDFPGVQLIDHGTLKALRECDTDPRKFPMLRIDIKGYPTREVPNPIYVPPSAAMVMPYGSFKSPAPSVRAKTRALNRGLDALLGVGDMPRMVEVSAERLAALELVYKHAVELCDAIDAAEEDIGGHRSTSEILGDLGPATSKVDELTRRVRDENEG